MVLQMARPQKNPKSGVYYFRQKTPADLVAAFGHKEASWSLRTKDPEEAKRRNAEAVRKQAMVWAALRKRPEPLPHQQIVALSGILYRDHMAVMELEPGEPQVWTETLKLLDRVASGPDGLESWYGPTVDNLKAGMARRSITFCSNAGSSPTRPAAIASFRKPTAPFGRWPNSS